MTKNDLLTKKMTLSQQNDKNDQINGGLRIPSVGITGCTTGRRPFRIP